MSVESNEERLKIWINLYKEAHRRKEKGSINITSEGINQIFIDINRSLWVGTTQWRIASWLMENILRLIVYMY